MVTALFARLRKIRDFIGSKLVRLQDSLGEKKENRFDMRVGVPLPLLDSADELGTSFWGDHIGGDMVWAKGARFFESGLPFGWALVGQAIDEVEIELRNSRVTRIRHSGGDGGAVVSAPKPSKVSRAKSLNTEAKSGDSCVVEKRCFGRAEAVWISLHSPLLRLAPRGDLKKFLKKGRGKSGRSSSAKENPFGR
jgi:hypothetical protein